ncbi:MAG: ATP-binding cassette domain-containing protein [Actinomycetota bacterium]|nr:ATP-binding cassette domain-containing protein [Actinomycetota bacterium]
MTEPDTMSPAPADVGAGGALVEMRGIRRRFGDTVALDGVDLTLRPGEISALLGANGAGKTTLMRILAGLDRPDDGSVSVLGEHVDRFDPGELRRRGVALVQQHFTLVPTLTASENLVLARPTSRWIPRGGAGRARLAWLVERTGLEVRDGVPAGRLSVGEQQRLELLRALDADARVLLLDEPTAVLTDAEADKLMAVCRDLAAEGRALVIITHRLAEVFAGCDRVSVLREGREVLADEPVAGHDRASLATAMIGSDSSGTFTDRVERRPPDDPDSAAVAGLCLRGVGLGRLRELDLDVAPGEIVGVAGVDGNGQSELESVLSGRVAPDAGRIDVHGEPLAVGDPRARGEQRLAYIPSDRYRWGLIRPMDLSDNLELGRVPRWRLRRRQRRAHAAQPLEGWDVRSAGPAARAASLSGGNAQKLVLARELGREPRAVLACYPTRGLDPGAADAVAERLVACAADGAAVLWIGAELDELLAVADRIVVLAAGELRGPFAPPFDRAAIGMAMVGDGHTDELAPQGAAVAAAGFPDGEVAP